MLERNLRRNLQNCNLWSF